MRYTLAQLLQTFGRPTYQRGLDYADDGRVLSASTDGTVIDGVVRGSRGQIYTQQIRCNFRSKVLLGFEGECSCPVAYNCKHVAAVLIQILRSEAMPAEDTATTDGLVAQATTPPSVVLPVALAEWLARIDQAVSPQQPVLPGAVTASARTGSKASYRLLFALLPVRQGHRSTVGLAVCKARLRNSGDIAAAESVFDLQRLLYSPPSYMVDADDEPLRLLTAIRGMYGYGAHTQPQGRLGAQLLQMLLEQGRLYWADSSPALAKGSVKLLQTGLPIPAQLAWQEEGRLFRLTWQLPQIPGAAHVLNTEPPLYVDGVCCGEVVPASAGALTPAHLCDLVRQAPLLDAGNREAVARLLLAHGLQDIIPLPQALQEIVREGVTAQPLLILGCAPLADGRQADVAQLGFIYDGQRCTGQASAIVRQTAQGVEKILRDLVAEQAAYARLTALGFAAPDPALPSASGALPELLLLPDQAAWLRFARDDLPALIDLGWQIDKRPGYRFDLAEIEEWYADIDEPGSGQAWFDLELGIIVNRERISLLPVLVELIRSMPQEFDMQTLAAHADHDELLAPLPGGAAVALPWGRIKPILTILGELYFTDRSGAALRLSTVDAARLAELEDATQLRWLGGERLRRLGQRISSFGGVVDVAPPSGLQAELRGYQAEGVAWLQFLREYGLAGILADDMGLGKTIQTLAHILIEQQAGRLTKPALVVAPTSLMGNWQDEAARFAPSLRVLVLQGKERLTRFDQIDQADLVLTTYALLPRDEEMLRAHSYHLVILDEAHYIKNARSKAAQVAGMLDAAHRLCLTGTPLENHLGELWSQFHFLMPGLLGDDKSFNRLFRVPIEKYGDDARRALLMRRLKPFILRRTKDKVARELPPKTEMVRNVEITGAQRDLYETVRLAMDKKVRDEITKKGVARSQIVILDALLKLRQVCCDPRLVKTAGVRKSTAPSAKLAELLEMLDALLEEGRRILVFSQFTSMLALIEAELQARRIPYALLTGDTVDRTGVVQSFQQGRVPLFLISLKAGGVGLNLTAADTVIHYDPWWNPAAETQATDRAWRIGQDKPVFVYKLIAKGTLEEKIQALQQKKAALAQAILDGGGTQGIKITQEDLQGIFAPLAE